jgi:hypothetical protein
MAAFVCSHVACRRLTQACPAATAAARCTTATGHPPRLSGPMANPSLDKLTSKSEEESEGASAWGTPLRRQGASSHLGERESVTWGGHSADSRWASQATMPSSALVKMVRWHSNESCLWLEQSRARGKGRSVCSPPARHREGGLRGPQCRDPGPPCKCR